MLLISENVLLPVRNEKGMIWFSYQKQQKGSFATKSSCSAFTLWCSSDIHSVYACPKIPRRLSVYMKEDQIMEKALLRFWFSCTVVIVNVCKLEYAVQLWYWGKVAKTVKSLKVFLKVTASKRNWEVLFLFQPNVQVFTTFCLHFFSCWQWAHS